MTTQFDSYYFQIKRGSMEVQQGWDALPPSIPRPKEYGTPQIVQMIATECPYTAHGLSVMLASNADV